jgi:hypothetical protein
MAGCFVPVGARCPIMATNQEVAVSSSAGRATSLREVAAALESPAHATARSAHHERGRVNLLTDASGSRLPASHPAVSRWLLAIDLLSARALVWIASVGRDANLTPEAHLFFADRYNRLADHHRRRGRLGKAMRLASRAEEHLTASGYDGPPFAAAMAMPRPRRFLRTDAISRARLDPPDDAA